MALGRAKSLVAALVLALVLAGCGYDRLPSEFRPANGDCGTLAGDYIVDEADLRWFAPHRDLPSRARFPFLRIEDDGRGVLSLSLLRRTSDVLAEATTLRLTRPDDYLAWRAWVLGVPMEPQLTGIPTARSGPVASHRWQMSAHRCDGGWRGGGQGEEVSPRPGSDDVRHFASISLARGKRGELLVQHQVRIERASGLSFRDQSLRWYRYVYSEWHAIPAAPAGTAPVALTAGDLPMIPDRTQRMAVDFARREQWSRFQAWLRENLPADTTVTVFRETQMDPEAMQRLPSQRRIEIAGHWTIGAPDPFTPLLASRPDVSDIEVKQSRLQANNRPYLLVEFTLTAKP